MKHRDYSGAIRWQVEHGVPVTLIACLFGKAPRSIPVIAWRDANSLYPTKVTDVLSAVNESGMSADNLLASARPEKTDADIDDSNLEAELDNFGREFWRKVRDQRGVTELGLLLRKVSKPSPENLPLRRAAARLYHLLAELYLHAGACRSSLTFATKAYRAEEALYAETRGKAELFAIGKTSLLVSQALINRSQFRVALPWIYRSQRAFTAGSHQVDPEAYKQLATVQFHTGEIDQARNNFITAGRLLPDYRFTQGVTVAQVRDIGDRHLNLIGTPDWERAFDLMEFAIRAWPAGDIHKALNVNWSAAAALMTDSKEASGKALALLSESGRRFSRGYLHPQTVTELLLMTPELPRAVRVEWARFSLHYNAFRNK